jgi:predicted AAA+ superfamily ATPase
MKRDIYQKLLDWKSDRRRKPLLLQGARHTGKPFILKAFARNEYDNVMYCNFEEDPGLDPSWKSKLSASFPHDFYGVP